MPTPRPDWPNGARCAVALTFDNFGESYDLLRYGHAGGADADGVYAPRRGVERILGLLDRYKIPATFFIEGWNARKYATLAREIAQRGHEVAAHGWMHEQWGTLGPQQELSLILKTTETISEVMGFPPSGWRSPGGQITANTLQFLSKEGYVYDSSFGDDDVPYRIKTEPNSAKTMIELPWYWPLDDAMYYSPSRAIRRPGEVADMWMEEFDAAQEMTGYFIVVCHPRFSGRPSRIGALEQLIEHIVSTDGVWFARCADIAEVTASWTDVPRYSAIERVSGEGES
jgi:peptidoglycan/xylan/chitin deacetylase (PgdA/CDA1 family)